MRTALFVFGLVLLMLLVDLLPVEISSILGPVAIGAFIGGLLGGMFALARSGR
jgi:uncharacterized membrane protein